MWWHFGKLGAVRQATGTSIEVLVPDFIGKSGALERLLQSRPDVCPAPKRCHVSIGKCVGAKACMSGRSNYLQIQKIMPRTKTKSGLMLGLGETREELMQVFDDVEPQR